MSTDHRNAHYHDAHTDDPGEWDEASVEDVTSRPSGTTVFSLRLPRDEFRLLREEARRRHVSVSELTRTALRRYLAPEASGSLSATALSNLQVSSYTPPWNGGTGDAATVERADSEVEPPTGNAVLR